MIVHAARWGLRGGGMTRFARRHWYDVRNG
jgi:hypothetical protein